MSNEPIAEALADLLQMEGLSLRALAHEVDVDHSHISRALRAGNGRVISGELASRIAEALGLPFDYFPETRTAFVHQAIDADAELRERIYRALKKAQ
jgi:transcriptional regulator with XRE-family HTH domain